MTNNTAPVYDRTESFKAESIRELSEILVNQFPYEARDQTEIGENPVEKLHGELEEEYNNYDGSEKQFIRKVIIETCEPDGLIETEDSNQSFTLLYL